MEEVLNILAFRNEGWCCDNHLNFTLWYRTATGKTAWKNGTTDFMLFETAEAQIDYVMQYQTPYVREHWLRLEVTVPNRDSYGNLRSGWIQDTGVLLATRELGD